MTKFFGFSSLSKNNKIDIKNINVEYEKNYPVEKFFEYQDNYIQIKSFKLKSNNKIYLQDDNIKIIFVGYCYNLLELNKLFNKNYKSIEELIFWSLQNKYLKKLLNKIDGYFSLCIYDKNNSKIILANDRFGLKPLYIYNKAGNFAFSNEIKDILFLDFIDKKINPRAFSCFKKFEAFIGEITWFKYINLLKPATFLEYDLKTNISKIEHYWTFKEIKKSNLDFNSAVKKAYELFSETIENYCADSDFLYVIPISGGLDSRLCLAMFRKLIKKPPYVFTFGIENCRDFINAKKVCRIAKVKHNKFYFKNIDWFNLRKNLIYYTDCNFSMMHMHGMEFDLNINENSRFINGFAGDAVFGNTYLPKNKNYFNKKFNKQMAIEYFGEFFDLCGYDSEYFDISNPIFCRLLNRVRRFTSSPFIFSENKIHTLKPFFSNRIIEFVASLPNEYLEDYKLYKNLCLKYFGKYFYFIHHNKNLPLYLKKDLRYYFNFYINKFSEFLQKKNIKTKIIDNYVLYNDWIKEPYLKSLISDIIKKENSFYKNFDSNDYEKLFNEDKINAKDVLCITSCELYFKQLNKKLKEKNYDTF